VELGFLSPPVCDMTAAVERHYFFVDVLDGLGE